MNKVFERSDIVLASLNPVEDKELQSSYRPCLVLSKKEFNRLGLTLIAPEFITNDVLARLSAIIN